MSVSTLSRVSSKHPALAILFDARAIVHGSVDGWFWAECRECTWPGSCHRDRVQAQRDADKHNMDVHKHDGTREDGSGVELEEAFTEYRAGLYQDALARLRSLILTMRARNGTTSLSGFGIQELFTRALTFINEIAPRPTQRETAAALMMVSSLFGS